MVEQAVAVVALAIGVLVVFLIARGRWGARQPESEPVGTILLPFTGTEISRRALDASIRLARAEGATLMPAYLATVPMQLPLECAMPGEARKAMPMLEAIEQRAEAGNIPIDARIERGRSYRHALRRLLELETFDRVVVPATRSGSPGFSGADLVWLLEKVPAEVLILRPGPQDDRVISTKGSKGSSSRAKRPNPFKLESAEQGSDDDCVPMTWDV